MRYSVTRQRSCNLSALFNGYIVEQSSLLIDKLATWHRFSRHYLKCGACCWQALSLVIRFFFFIYFFHFLLIPINYYAQLDKLQSANYSGFSAKSLNKLFKNHSRLFKPDFKLIGQNKR